MENQSKLNTLKSWLFEKYSEKNLCQGESILFQTSKHWINFFNKYLVLSLLITPFLGFYFIPLLVSLGLNYLNYYILINTDECVVTSKRVIFKTGLVVTNTIEMNLSKIESIYVEQSMIGRILKYGTITIKGTGGSVETFKKINQPLQIRTCIQENSF
jgi:uncharacterized membrane protein YdbT with pleckstrin-like domain